MREVYPAYQSRTHEEFRQLWDKAIFAFDANSLLDLYRISERARNNYLQILKSLQDRLWLPHQAGLEFYANREEVVDAGLKAFTKIPEFAKKAASDFRTAIREYESYQWTDLDDIAQTFDRAAKRIGRTLRNVPQKWKRLQNRDPIEPVLADIFKNQVGKPYADMDRIYERAERRVALRMPPGFKERKEDYRKYGDVVIWFQLLDHGKEIGKPIVWVSRDNKEDWWLREGGKVKGPRPELIHEMHTVAAVAFHMYSPDQFLKHAAVALKGKASSELKDTAEELHEIAKETSKDTGVVSNIIFSGSFLGGRVFL